MRCLQILDVVSDTALLATSSSFAQSIRFVRHPRRLVFEHKVDLIGEAWARLTQLLAIHTLFSSFVAFLPS